MMKKSLRIRSQVRDTLSFAHFLCDKEGLKIPTDILSSSKNISGRLNKNKKKEDVKNVSEGASAHKISKQN